MFALEAGSAAAGEGRLLASPAVRLLRLGERAALFCERTQALHELNPTAAIIWSRLISGSPTGSAAAELEALGAAPADARRFVQESAEAWLEAGLLIPADLPARLSQAPSVELHLRVGPAAARLALHIDPADALGREIAGVFRPFLSSPRARAASLAVATHQGRYLVASDGVPRGWLPADRVVPELKAALTERLAAATGEGAFLLHAALLSRGANGLLITGAPGAGKTTLTLALAARGLGFAADDIVQVRADGRLIGVPFSPASKAGAWPLLEPFSPGLGRLRQHLRADGQAVRYVPMPAAVQPHRLGWIILLDRRPDGAARLEPMEPLAALAELLAGAICAERRMQGCSLEAFAKVVAGAQARRLVFSDLESALAAVEELVRGPGA